MTCKADSLLLTSVCCPSWCRPIAEYVSDRASAATTAVTEICRLGWNISSTNALHLLKSQLVQSACPTLQKVCSIVWLAAAALAADTVDLVAPPATVALEAACRVVDTDKIPMPMFLCLMLLYAVG